MQKEKNEVSETSMPEKGNPDQKEKKEKNGKKTALRVLIIVFSILAGLILLGICVYHGVVDYYLSKINYETDGQEDLIYETQRIVEEIPEETEAEASTSEENPEQTEEQPADQPAMEEIDLHGTYGTKDLPRICDTKDVTNILLLATDSRGLDAGRSDTMILDAVLAAQNPGLNPELIRVAFCQHFPQFAPEFVSFHRKEALDAEGKRFR